MLNSRNILEFLPETMLKTRKTFLKKLLIALVTQLPATTIIMFIIW